MPASLNTPGMRRLNFYAGLWIAPRKTGHGAGDGHWSFTVPFARGGMGSWNVGLVAAAMRPVQNKKTLLTVTATQTVDNIIISSPKSSKVDGDLFLGRASKVGGGVLLGTAAKMEGKGLTAVRRRV